MRVCGFMLVFLVIVWDSDVPTPFIFDSAWVTFRVPSMSLSAMRTMCLNSLVDILVGVRSCLGYQVSEGFFI